MTIIRAYLFFMLTFLASAMALPDSDATNALIKNLSVDQKIQGQFTQTIYDHNHAVLLKSQGGFALMRPIQATGENGKFRWDTNTPSKQLLIADGHKIYFYDTALQQVTVQKQKSLVIQNSPAMLLSGDLQQISKQYQVTLQKKADQISFTLKPLKQTFFSQVKIIFNEKNGINTLSEMHIIDNLNQNTEIQLTHLSDLVNPNLFEFTAPHGVDIVNTGT